MGKIYKKLTIDNDGNWKIEDRIPVLNDKISYDPQKTLDMESVCEYEETLEAYLKFGGDRTDYRYRFYRLKRNMMKKILGKRFKMTDLEKSNAWHNVLSEYFFAIETNNMNLMVETEKHLEKMRSGNYE